MWFVRLATSVQSVCLSVPVLFLDLFLKSPNLNPLQLTSPDASLSTFWEVFLLCALFHTSITTSLAFLVILTGVQSHGTMYDSSLLCHHHC